MEYLQQHTAGAISNRGKTAADRDLATLAKAAKGISESKPAESTLEWQEARGEVPEPERGPQPVAEVEWEHDETELGRTELRGLLQQDRGNRQGFQQIIVVSLQVAAVILMTVAQILAVSDLRKHFRPVFRPVETAENPPCSGRETAANPAPVCDAPPPIPFDRRSTLETVSLGAVEKVERYLAEYSIGTAPAVS